MIASGGEGAARRMLPSLIAAIQSRDLARVTGLFAEQLSTGSNRLRPRATVVSRIGVYARQLRYLNDLALEDLVDLGRVTREHKEIRLGLSPRGLITWQRVAQARAHLRGREFVTPDDIQEVARPVLEVRLSSDFDAAGHAVDDVLSSVSVPVLHAMKRK